MFADFELNDFKYLSYKLDALKYLYLDHYKHWYFLDDLRTFKQLETLSLPHIKSSIISPAIDYAIDSLSNLKVLDLQYNNLKKFPVQLNELE